MYSNVKVMRSNGKTMRGNGKAMHSNVMHWIIGYLPSPFLASWRSNQILQQEWNIIILSDKCNVYLHKAKSLSTGGTHVIMVII